MRTLLSLLVAAVLAAGGATALPGAAQAQCANANSCLSTSVRGNSSYFRLLVRNSCSRIVRVCACWQRRNGDYTNCGCERIVSRGDFHATRSGNTGRVRYGSFYQGCSRNIINAFRLRR